LSIEAAQPALDTRVLEALAPKTILVGAISMGDPQVESPETVAERIRAAVAGQPEIAVGNVIGSNIFNALGVVGVASLLGSVTAPASVVQFAIPGMLLVTVLCFFVLQEREATAYDGWLLLVLYAGFISQLFRIG